MSLLNESCPKLSIRLYSAPYITHQHIVYYINIISSKGRKYRRKKETMCVCVCKHIYHTVGCRNLTTFGLHLHWKWCQSLQWCPLIQHWRLPLDYSYPNILLLRISFAISFMHFSLGEERCKPVGPWVSQGCTLPVPPF